MKVYKLSLYTDEKELTEINLGELSEVVDTFVFLEPSHTHQKAIREEFPNFPFKGKNICYRTYTDFSEELMSLQPDQIEKKISQHFVHILEELEVQPEDIILFGDADEIPYKETLKALIPHIKPGEIYGLEMLFCNYWINCLSFENPWTRFKVFKYQTLLDIKEQLGGTCSLHKDIREKFTGIIVPNGGWHWSWFGGKPQLIKKLESYGHYELNLPQFKTDEHINYCLQTGTDLFLRGPGKVLELEETTMPQYVIDNIEKYKHFIHPDQRARI
jgi:beta-1,4-mannosyl-glycoprotein beta-1,4-N-acetylglucosaminyltransferase